MKLKAYHKATSIEDAFCLLEENEGSTLIAGGAWQKLGKKEYSLGIDLSELEMNQIIIDKEQITLGAMVTLYDIERHEEINELPFAILSKAASLVMGVPLRNIATIGGSVCGKYGFSDLITPLLALNAQLNFYKKGTVSLETFLTSKDRKPDILISVVIPRVEGKGTFEVIKKTSIDFSIINVAVLKVKEDIRIVIGSRPGGAVLKVLKASDIEDKNEIVAGDKLVNEIAFGSNSRASETYRREVARVLINRGVKEVLA